MGSIPTPGTHDPSGLARRTDPIARMFASVKVGEDGGRVFTSVLTNLGALPAKLDG